MRSYQLMTLLVLLIVFQLLLMAYQAIVLQNVKISLRKTQHKHRLWAQKQEALLHTLYLPFRQLPFPLIDIPFTAVQVKKVHIPSASAAYNGSIGLVENCFVLFFRYDTSIASHMGCIPLDRDFEPLEKQFSKIETYSRCAEDARFFQNNGSSFLVYNDLVAEQRILKIGAFDFAQKKIANTTTLRLHSKKAEKNWTPFSYKGEIHFIYTIQPLKILILHNDKISSLKITSVVENSSMLDWETRWGALRGGTPALLVDGEYLAFFHSSFEDRQGVIWYVMGAYTFNPSPPFNITRISCHPILFDGIYDTPYQPGAHPKIRSIYPMGFVCEQREGREWIHLSCGENDSGIKILSMEKQNLFSSLKTI